VNWVAHFSGHGVAFLNRGGNWDLNWDRVAFGDWLGNTVGLWDLSDNGVAFSHWLWVAHGVGDIPGGGNAHGLGDSNAVGDRDTLGNSDSAHSVDWNLPALSLNLLLALGSGGNCHGSSMSNGYRSGMSNCHWSSSKWSGNWGGYRGNWKRSSGKSGSNGSGGSKRGSHWGTSKSNVEWIESQELGISFSIGIGFSVSLTLSNSLGKKGGSGWEYTGSSWEGGVEADGSRKWARSSNEGSSGGNGVTNNMAVGLDMNLSLGADVVDNVVALVHEGGFRNLLCLGGALGHFGALLLNFSGAPLVWYLCDHVGALLFGPGSTLFLGDVSCGGGALLDRSGGALFLGLGDIVGHGSGVAN